MAAASVRAVFDFLTARYAVKKSKTVKNSQKLQLITDVRTLPTSLIQTTEIRVPTDLYHRYKYNAQMQRHKTICNKTYDTPLKILVM